MVNWKRYAAALCSVFTICSVFAGAECNTRKYYECYEYEESEEDTKVWKEQAVVLPAAPDVQKLIPFEVSVANPNRFLVDPASISIGEDGVVRYTVVIESSGGARTVNYEGVRCYSRERRLYAFGQSDGSWIKSQGTGWIQMHKQQGQALNGYSAVLADEYFCQSRAPVKDVSTAVERLNYGSAAISAR